MRICERSNSADTKASTEGEGGGAADARAEIPLQSVESMVRQAVPLQSVEARSGTDLHLRPVENPTPEQVDA